MTVACLHLRVDAFAFIPLSVLCRLRPPGRIDLGRGWVLGLRPLPALCVCVSVCVCVCVCVSVFLLCHEEDEAQRGYRQPDVVLCEVI